MVGSSSMLIRVQNTGKGDVQGGISSTRASEGADMRGDETPERYRVRSPSIALPEPRVHNCLCEISLSIRRVQTGVVLEIVPARGVLVSSMSSTILYQPLR
ncbi:hypothetical protein CERSUDRAFT_113483 [Gelatoporia subvermispora B]|uniref:Uncharacterized protein n=1 Tax=Ceriporiopsis subvermispora (strain B) TaxID=914234 RepID=M2RHP3_CERS8|nr:hypothetical protein CERSUDRAFT_113483 [Gelatoporia subvermispora B]